MRTTWAKIGCCASLCTLVANAGCEACDAEVRPSVTLYVVDADSGQDVDATVTFTLDGEGPRSPEEGWPGTYVLTSEEAGVFAVTIAAAGYQTVMRDYTVDADECHVQSIEDTIPLEPG